MTELQPGEILLLPAPLPAPEYLEFLLLMVLLMVFFRLVYLPIRGFLLGLSWLLLKIDKKVVAKREIQG